jgi:ATP-binding cassette subfamily F protein uup
LDLDTLRALEDYLDEWPGIVVVVSHDRVFLDRTVIDVLALDGHGGAAVVPGGVAGWLKNHNASPTHQIAAAQRGKLIAQDATVVASASTLTSAAKAKPAKSPSTLKRLLAQAEKTLAQATAAEQKIAEELAQAGSDHTALARISANLANAQTKVAAAEENWIALAAEAEAQEIDIR